MERVGLGVHVTADDVGAVRYALVSDAGGEIAQSPEPEFQGPDGTLIGCYRVRAQLAVETLVSGETCIPPR